MRGHASGIWVAALAALAGCSESINSPGVMVTPAPGEPDLRPVIAGYRSYTKVTPVRYQRSSAHPGLVDIYVSPAHVSRYRSASAVNPAPDGMTVVKERLNFDGSLLTLDIMIKVRNFDSANGDWFYAETSGPTVIRKGNPQLCVSCHQGYRSHDYLAAPVEVPNQISVP